MAPTIIRSPASTTVLAGASASFSAETGGGAVASSQWLRNGAEIPGAAGLAYSYGPVSLLESGRTFALRVGNIAGSVISEAATLTVTSPPVVLVSGDRNAIGDVDGPAGVARIEAADAMAVDDAGNVYLATRSTGPGFTGGRSVVRKVAVDGTVTVFVGERGLAGTVDGAGTAARFTDIVGLWWDRASKRLLLVDYRATNFPVLYRICEVTPEGVVTSRSSFSVTGQFQDPMDYGGRYVVAWAPDGTLYIGGGSFRRPGGLAGTVPVPTAVFKVAPGGSPVLLAGDPASQGSSDGVGANARFFAVSALAADAAGNVYVAEHDGVRRIAADGSVTTLAGVSRSPTGVAVPIADGQGPAVVFNGITGIALEAAGTLLVYGGAALRRMTPDGKVITLASLGPIAGGLGLDAAGKPYFTAFSWVGRVDGLAAAA